LPQVDDGAVPGTLMVQVPLLVAPRAAEQTSQGPLHAESQQKPLAQLPLAHSVPRLHVDPVAF
jgi:hypothetical protein